MDVNLTSFIEYKYHIDFTYN